MIEEMFVVQTLAIDPMTGKAVGQWTQATGTLVRAKAVATAEAIEDDRHGNLVKCRIRPVGA